MFRKRIDLLFSAAVVVLLAWTVWEARVWPVHSRIFPWSVGIGVLLLALAQLVSAARGVIRSGRPEGVDAVSGAISDGRENQEASAPAAPRDAPPHQQARRRIVVICSWILVFFAGVWLLGFRVGSFVLTAAFLRWGAAERWRVSLAAAGVSYLFFLVVFYLILQVPLPAGLLAESLGVDSLDDYAIRSLRSLAR